MVSGLDLIADGRSFALTDLDRDGGVDIVVVNANAPLLQVLSNQIGSQQGFVAVRLEGGNTAADSDSEWSNRDGVGARLSLRAGELNSLRELQFGEGLAAQNSETLVIGLGGAKNADEIVVRWPSGRTQQIEQVESGSLVVFRESADVVVGAYNSAD
ncbi:MAG: ASPIC/UnbV domain-containing protein [Myxococcota bacterium]|nr:ASPIC/UnbV domain-containing protein [Myxococcota bacterium]